jgi:hypothetical protein
MSEKDTVRLNITPEVVALAEHEARKATRWRNGPVAALGLFGVVGGVSFFVAPTNVADSPIGRNLSGPGDELWSAAILLGGLLVVVGSLRPWQLVELFGWAVYVPALVAYCVAIVVVLGAEPPALFYGLAIAGAGAAKIVYLTFYAPRVTMIRVERRTPENRGAPYGGAERRGG